MAFESCEANLTRGSSTTRLARGFVHTAAAGAVLLVLTAALSAQGGDKAKVSELVKSDLSRLADLERTWYEKNRTFTIDLRALGFAPASGANITMAYATARSWSGEAPSGPVSRSWFRTNATNGVSRSTPAAIDSTGTAS